MKSSTITGGGGAQLHVVESGNAEGRPILFIHGFSQCWLAWSRQMSSSLAERYRLVAMDIRGHGLSDKPRDGYDDSRLWADDVKAVLESLSLDHPVLSGWSYGPLVILDYIRHYGEERLGGIQFVGGISKLGSEAAAAAISPEFLGLVPGFFSSQVDESARSAESLVRLCFGELSEADRYMMLGYNLSVPPYVRSGMFSRSFDNDDLLPQIRKPVLITHGADDAVVKPSVVDQHKAAMAHAEVDLVANMGHTPFWGDAARFNQRLSAFVESLSAGSQRRQHGAP